jgi:putative transposase
LCRLFGKTRHALYDHLWRYEQETIKDEIILQLVDKTRLDLPRVGARKLLFLLQPDLLSHGLKLGRDELFDLLAEHKMLIRQRKRKMITTDSRHNMRKYENLIKTLLIDRPEQLWVSDITYIRMKNQWGYLSMITDSYSKQIMGISFRLDMSVQGCLEALTNALSNRKYPTSRLIHHSDRGSQYCCKDYISLLRQNGIAVSMTENGDPYENPLAERMNNTLKNEFNLHSTSLNYEQTYELIKRRVHAYNSIRPHDSCDYLTPAQAHLQTSVLKKRWKKYPKAWQRKNELKKETLI